ncbi:MAG: NAD(P)/FAD-dependent oxidoreductase, partial [Gammaproteobacteria bacterium]|nr:NAD(P)/FAD-dependent oxidoreductase [Gammaproteobacteria bacterium]
MTINTDALIIGAGPAGLFQVFELGLLGIKADLVDTLSAPGGQCAWLYPDKPIYDIPAVPVCTGGELVANLMKQIEPFHPTFHLGEELVELKAVEGGFAASTSAGKQFLARTVFIAAGVGSFQPRRVHVEGADALEGSQIHYHVKDPADFAGKRLVIFGGGDSALDWALALGPKAAALTLVHRRDEYRAAPASVALLKERAGRGEVRLVELANPTGLRMDGARMTGVEVTDKSGTTQVIEADHALVFYGLSPKLGPIANWGLEFNKKAIVVDTEKFQSNIPGIFAIGDIC